jgi:hypothetical protein
LTIEALEKIDQHGSDILEQWTHMPFLSAYKPRAAAIEAIPNLKSLWRARTTEQLQQALDDAQNAILEALESEDCRTRLKAAKLMLRTRAARERGWS